MLYSFVGCNLSGEGKKGNDCYILKCLLIDCGGGGRGKFLVFGFFI